MRGVVTVSGDAAPEMPDVLAKIGEDCAPAREVYGRLFREGTGRTLADVLVAVTGYKGYVPEQHSIVTVPASGCAWSSRTLAVTFGQRIDVVAKDRKAYVPDLLGAKMPAQLIALPGGAGSTVYAQQPGRYVLVDSLRIYSMADVLVLKYATHDVTGLDGKFQIERIPAGRVTVSALLPATGDGSVDRPPVTRGMSTVSTFAPSFIPTSSLRVSSVARRSLTTSSTLERPSAKSFVRSSAGRSVIKLASVMPRAWIHLKTCLPWKLRPPSRTTSSAHSSGKRAIGGIGPGARVGGEDAATRGS